MCVRVCVCMYMYTYFTRASLRGHCPAEFSHQQPPQSAAMRATEVTCVLFHW